MTSLQSFGDIGVLHNAGPLLLSVIVLGFVFAECAFLIGLFLPGDSLLITAGIVLTAHGGSWEIWLLAAGSMFAALAGNQVGYTLGSRHGRKAIARRNGRYLNMENLRKATDLMDRHGFWGVVVARWVPWVRTLCPHIAGAAGMNRRRYTLASSIGAVAWSPVVLLIGYYGGDQLRRVPWLLPTVAGVLLVALVGATAVGVWHYRQEMAKPADSHELDLVDV